MRSKILTFIMAVLLIFTGMSFPEKTSASGEIERISGANRIDTALEVSKKVSPGKLATAEKAVILTRSDMPFDALASSGLAGVKQAPILLTASSRLDAKVSKELDRLGAKKIYILGGTTAISQGIEDELKKTYTVARVEGSTRYETANAINKASGLDQSSTAIVVNGNQVADSLSASSVAAMKNYPIYLTTETKAPSLPSSIKTVYVIGGNAVLSDAVITKLEQQGKKVIRLAGDDRFLTNIAVNKAFFSSNSSYILARGISVQQDKEDYPDAVAAAPLAEKFNAPVVLAHNARPIPDVQTYLYQNASSLMVLGGEAAIPSSIVDSYKMKDKVEEVVLETGIVTASSLNVRTSPEMNGTRIGALPRNAEVDIYGYSGDWAKIKYQGQVAYVHSGYLILKSSNLLNNLTIVVDAGHGDHDPGASNGKLLEKDINLDVALYLEKKLKSAGANVVMTRRDDSFLELRERSNIANNLNADAFISVHTNAASEAAHGIETYWYDKYSSAESKALAESIQKRLIEVTEASNRGVKNQSFSVIRESRMASVLVEVGFLTNNEEYKLLLTQSYREELADGIYQGVLDYYKTN
ncbi:N-acetylmuramoyl-L-alanine amidase [Alkalihalobacillus hwajinpoensis]|uniref:N-acetylmuramoyl-L-alanine amidase n=1 Tax=Guptibacillus hwajinpoensis TaxID=208199 RepID=UPI00188394A4|nr:N-acetylmuramoyl-L-alanine amidase [Pseudalkalibacillus hwajinpoensis]MBF0707262.1 N-acetylmuramoyl-L-alanine amidase [Pseudalkalibacillus hwajinpoensis]